MQIYLENNQNREGDWFTADFYNPNYFGIDLAKVQRACGTNNPKELMVIDIDYNKDEPYAYLLQYDDRGWTTLQSLSNQVAELDLASLSEYDLQEISAYLNVNGGTLADAVNDYEDATYIHADYDDYKDLAFDIITQWGCDEDMLAEYFDYGLFGEYLINSYATSTSEGEEELFDTYGTDDAWAIGEYYIEDVYGDVERYIKEVGLEDAMEYFNYEGYGNSLMTGGNVHYDKNTELWVMESMNYDNKSHINEALTRDIIDVSNYIKFRADVYSPNDSRHDSLIKRFYIYANTADDARSQAFNELPTEIKRKFKISDDSSIEVTKVNESLKTERKGSKMIRRLSNKMTEKRMPRRMTEGESYGWVVEPWEAWDAYDMACECMGKDYVDDAIVHCMDTDELSECLAFLFRNWDFTEWDERESQNESINRKHSLRRRNK